MEDGYRIKVRLRGDEFWLTLQRRLHPEVAEADRLTAAFGEIERLDWHLTEGGVASDNSLIRASEIVEIRVRA